MGRFFWKNSKIQPLHDKSDSARAYAPGPFCTWRHLRSEKLEAFHIGVLVLERLPRTY